MKVILDDIRADDGEFHDLTLGRGLRGRLVGEVSVAVVTGSGTYILKAGDLVARKPAASVTGVSLLSADELLWRVRVEDTTFFTDGLVWIGGRGLGGVGGGETETSEEVIDLTLETLVVSSEALNISGEALVVGEKGAVVGLQTLDLPL
jgi:hypothetical protein